MCNIYSYMRISTSEERDLQKFTRQESALQGYAKENSIEYLLEFKEDKSGKNFTKRKQWQKLESIVQLEIRLSLRIYADLQEKQSEKDNSPKN